ncbi:MAG: glycine betaine/L-proline ABC transporter substrate-binding protein ProX [Cyanobacteria bacterium P01_A01_bin.45]
MDVKKYQKKIQLFTIVTLLLTQVSCFSDRKQPGQGVTVRPAYGVLEELFQTEIINIGLEKLGYDVIPGAETDNDIIHQAIAADYLDYTPTYWYPQGNLQLDEEKVVRVGVLSDRAIQGYLIDKRSAEEFGITKLEQLKDPEIAKIFDTDGDGKANLIGCNPGWACQDAIDHHIEVYDLRNTVEHDKGNYNTLINETIKRSEQKKPILYFTWVPYWVGGALVPGKNVDWLEVPFLSLPPKQQKSLDKASINSKVTTIVDGKNLGYPVNQIQILVNKKFADQNPSARRFFELVKIPAKDISAQNYLMKKGKNTPERIRRQAEQWISDNQEQFDSWIEQARKVN